jgi:hypothetical protein
MPGSRLRQSRDTAVFLQRFQLPGKPVHERVILVCGQIENTLAVPTLKFRSAASSLVAGL